MLRVIKVNWNTVADIVPVDYVTNMLITIGWITALNKYVCIHINYYDWIDLSLSSVISLNAFNSAILKLICDKGFWQIASRKCCPAK